MIYLKTTADFTLVMDFESGNYSVPQWSVALGLRITSDTVHSAVESLTKKLIMCTENGEIMSLDFENKLSISKTTGCSDSENLIWDTSGNVADSAILTDGFASSFVQTVKTISTISSVYSLTKNPFNLTYVGKDGVINNHCGDSWSPTRYSI